MTRRIILVGSAILIVLIASGIGVMIARWPFTREAAAKSLGDAFASNVEFGTFHQIWFPDPGFEARNVLLTPTKGRAAGYAQVASLRVDSSWLDLFRHRVRLMTADGIDVEIRSLSEGAFAGHAGTTVIEHADLRRAVLQIGMESDSKRIDFHEVDLRNVGHGRQVPFRIAVAIPKPAGELKLDGKLGPLGYGQLPATPLNGSYELTGADLHVFDGIAGVLSSKGNYSGVLERLDVTGETDVPEFSVTESGHTRTI